MFITKIQIENYKGIKKIEIDLKPNSNGIEKDVKLDRFKIIDQRHPISGITALVGRNSVGKSTVIKALAFIQDVEMGFINNEIIDNLIREEISAIQSKKFFKGGMDNESLLESRKIASEKSREISKNIENKKGLDFQKYILKSTEWFSNFFETNNNGNENQAIIFTIDFLAKNNKYGEYKISLDNEGNLSRETRGDFIPENYKNYFRNIFAPHRFYEFQSQTPSFLNPKKGRANFFDLASIEIAVESMVSLVGEEETTKMLKLCDEDIIGIKYSRLANNSGIRIKNIIVKNKLIQAQDLSSGTKQFIILIEAIVRAFKGKKGYGLLLFDEIEINLHNELIQALFQMLTSLFKHSNIQSIITTHNIRSLKPLLSNKQILGIEKDDQRHEIFKASKIMKSHESLLTKQEQGLFAYYPDQELIRNTISDFIYQLKND